MACTGCFGRLKQIFISTKATPNIDHEHACSDEIWHAEIRGELRDEASRDRAAQHRRPLNHLAASEHLVELTFEAREPQRIDEPSFHCSGEEREAEPDHVETIAHCQNGACRCQSSQ